MLRLSRTAARLSRSARPQQLRPSCRGLASGPPDDLDAASNAARTGLSAELEQKANARWQELARQHRAIPADDETRRRRLVYRSKQRGWLEVDLLLGTWASEHVAGLTTEECDQYEDVLNCETIDIFNFITGKDPVPPRLDTPIMARLQDYCASSPLGVDPGAYADAKEGANLT